MSWNVQRERLFQIISYKLAICNQNNNQVISVTIYELLECIWIKKDQYAKILKKGNSCIRSIFSYKSKVISKSYGRKYSMPRSLVERESNMLKSWCRESHSFVQLLSSGILSYNFPSSSFPSHITITTKAILENWFERSLEIPEDFWINCLMVLWRLWFIFKKRLL